MPPCSRVVWKCYSRLMKLESLTLALFGLVLPGGCSTDFFGLEDNPTAVPPRTTSPETGRTEKRLSKHDTETEQKSDAGAKQPIPRDMLPVPGGTFKMGLNHPRAIPDEKSEHTVTLPTYLLDKTEVTNQAYGECVDLGVCAKPKSIDTSRHGYAPLSEFRKPNHPVSGISQTDAETYCRFRGKRLPTEAEFERAARGDDRRLYAWGNAPPAKELAQYRSKVTAKVGSKPKGAGPYGHLDLAGNVWEWTSDPYDPLAYTRPSASKGIPADCPTIKQTQDTLRRQGKQGFTGTNPIPRNCDHVLRGGAFNYFPWGLRASNRVHHPGHWKMIMAGFRCAKDIPPQDN